MFLFSFTFMSSYDAACFKFSLSFIRSALTEISVLYDVLNIVKEKHYMVTDPVSQDPPELRASLQMLAKKKVRDIYGMTVLGCYCNISKCELEVVGSKCHAISLVMQIL